MSRAFDPLNTDAPAPAIPASESPSVPPPPPLPADDLPPASPSPRRPVQHTVCPFCGHISEAGSTTCRQCGLENSHATRTATRNKMGPWYVWQGRNPSAPGMNWTTLLALIQKGRVTPRSIMRGPTTGQLWRFAARVKGVSREFGVCWHCGTSIQTTARLCPGCKRLQQPPINPDALLENDSPQAAQSRTVVDPRNGGLLSLAPNGDHSSEFAPQPEAQAALPGSSPQELAANEAVVNDMVNGALPVIDMGADAIPAAAEMRAFELPDVHKQQRRDSHVGRKMLVAAVIALACGNVAAWYSPQFHELCQRGYEALMAHVASANHQPLRKENNGDDNSVVADGKPGGDAKMDAPQEPTALMNAPSVAGSEIKPDPAALKNLPQVSFGPGAEGESALRPSATTAPIVAPLNHSTTESSVVVTPPPTDPQSAETRAWQLRDRALEAERQGDFATAVKNYQWIQEMRLPEGVGPSDIETRLMLAQKAAAGNKN